MTVAGLAGLIMFRQAGAGRTDQLYALYAIAAVLPMALMYLNLALLPLAPLVLAFQLLVLLGRVPGRREDAQQAAVVPRQP
jgi:hypothetical protein